MNSRMLMPIWMMGTFVVIMNTTMFNVSIPSVIRDLGVSAELGSWIISSYSIGFALSTVVFSRLSDSIPIRTLLAASLLTTGISSVFGLFSDAFGVVLLARIFQSAGGGAFVGLGLVIVRKYVPPERRGRSLAMISAGSAMAFGLGPVVGGTVSEYYGWNRVFAVTCLVFVVLPFLWRLLPREPRNPFRFDLGGAILTVANAVSLLLALSQRSWLWLSFGAVTIIAHAYHIHKAKLSFLNMGVYESVGFQKLSGIAFCLMAVNLGNLWLMPLVLSGVFRQTSLSIGFTIAPGAILAAALSLFFGRWIDRYGNAVFIWIGQSVMGSVLLLFSFGVSISPWVILGGYILFAPACSLMMSSVQNEAMRAMPEHSAGSGMGMLQLTQYVGGSLTVAFCGWLLSVQAALPAANAFSNVYRILLAAQLVSLALFTWYRKSNGRQAVTVSVR